LLFFYISK